MQKINQLLNNFRTDAYSEKELNDLLDVFQRPQHENAVDESMKMHWDECSNLTIGNDERFNRILSDIHHSINLKATKTIKPLWIKKLYTGVSRVAAIIVIPLMIALYVLIAHQQSTNFAVVQNTISVPLGATSQFDLPDGTHIWLNAGSKLTYPMSFTNQSNRVVALNGEGFFKVKKDKKCPFIVKMNGMDVKVTGTTFNARAYSDETTVIIALVEGSVLLGKQTPENNFEKRNDLHPMEVAVLSKADKQITLTQKCDLTKYTAWTEGRTVFDNDPILDVTEKLQKLYNVQVIIPDKELLQYHLTATFVNEPLERALKIISLSSPVTYQIVNGTKDINGTYGQRTLILKKANKFRSK